uniref:Intraflagellar transport protein 27 homolog isoform X2 n=1 Tax=Saccoglossus kowalevskii TaxID=10224 RepID=A0ABM0MG60_SACKO|nr:PREDICTED: intraflagellar transport protein 27 homolog isoform X2 [Saccoglossus kowalevskii]
MLTGDSAVGKSAITQVFHSDGAHFPKSYSMTVGVELCVKSVNIPDTNDCVELYIYDSAGKELYSDYVHKFWEHPSVVMVVFDVTNETSFKSCQKWLERVKNKTNQELPGVLVGNKIDLVGRRVISPKIAREFAMKNSLEYCECSAKEMENVEAAFYFVANAFYRLYEEKVEVMNTLV